MHVAVPGDAGRDHASSGPGLQRGGHACCEPHSEKTGCHFMLKRHLWDACDNLNMANLFGEQHMRENITKNVLADEND